MTSAIVNVSVNLIVFARYLTLYVYDAMFVGNFLPFLYIVVFILLLLVRPVAKRKNQHTFQESRYSFRRLNFIKFLLLKKEIFALYDYVGMLEPLTYNKFCCFWMRSTFYFVSQNCYIFFGLHWTLLHSKRFHGFSKYVFSCKKFRKKSFSLSKNHLTVSLFAFFVDGKIKLGWNTSNELSSDTIYWKWFTEKKNEHNEEIYCKCLTSNGLWAKCVVKIFHIGLDIKIGRRGEGMCICRAFIT